MDHQQSKRRRKRDYTPPALSFLDESDICSLIGPTPTQSSTSSAFLGGSLVGPTRSPSQAYDFFVVSDWALWASLGHCWKLLGSLHRQKDRHQNRKPCLFRRQDHASCYITTRKHAGNCQWKGLALSLLGNGNKRPTTILRRVYANRLLDNKPFFSIANALTCVLPMASK